MRNTARLLLFALVPLVALAGDPAESKLHLNLATAVRMALKKNFQIQVQSFSPQIAREELRSASGKFDPVFEVNYTRGEDTVRLVRQSNSAGTGLRGLAPWGLTWDIGYNTWDNVDFNPKWQAGLVQPLLRNFGPSANLAHIRIARRNEAISQWQVRQSVMDVITQIDYAYNELYFSEQSLRVAEQSQELARQLLDDNIRRAEIGTMSPLDITMARAQVAARHEAVILARSQMRDNEVVLHQLVSEDLEKILSTRVTIEPPPVVKAKVDPAAGVKDALVWRPDYRQAILDLEKKHITLVYERNQALPRLDLVGSLNLLGVGREFAINLGSLVNTNDTNWSAGAVFSIPLPNREARGRVNAARLDDVRALLDLKRLEQEIIVRVDIAARQITTSTERINSTREARVLARETLDAGEQKLQAGTTATFEVLELQKKLAEAEEAELRAQTDYNKAVSEYDRVTGMTLSVNRVELVP